MSAHPSPLLVRPLLLLALGLAACVPLHAAKPEGAPWHTADGRVVTGRLSEVYGSLALIAGKDFRVLIPVDKMTDEELGRVAEHLANPARQGATWEKSEARVTKALRKKLVHLVADDLAPYTPAGPEPKIYLVYFSAGWCGPCHRFTPRLTKAYQQWQQTYPGQVETVFVSWDRNAGEMRSYVREMKMPWKALAYSELGRASVIEQWAGNGIPCLVAMTPGGDVIFHSYKGEEYLGADHALESTEQLLQQAVDTPAARAPRHRLAVIQHVRARPEAAPVPYLTRFDPGRYRTLAVDVVEASLLVDARGHVTDAEILTPISTVLKDRFSHDLMDWLFLPAVAQGVPVERRITLPIELRQRKTASTDAGNPSGN